MRCEKSIEELCSFFEGIIAEEDMQETLFAVSEPVRYKELTFYPVKVKYYQFFNILSSVFSMTKYDSGIPECMGMNMLQFLFYSDKKKGIDNTLIALPMLQQLLEMCMQIPHWAENGEENIIFWKDGKKCFIKIFGKDYDWKDYETIRELIAKQNGVQLVDYSIHPDVRKLIDEKKKLRAQNSGSKTGTFEELVESLMLASKLSEECILNLTIRRFINLIQRYDIMLDYELYTLLSPYIDKKDKKPLPRWNGKAPQEDYFYSNVQKANALENKLNSIQ